MAVCRHRVRGFAAPYLLVLQHHFVSGKTRIVAPVVIINVRPANLLIPKIEVSRTVYHVMLLDMTSVALGRIAETVEARVDVQAVSDGLDAIFTGYPVGLPPN